MTEIAIEKGSWSKEEKQEFAKQRAELRDKFDQLTARERLLRQEQYLKFVESFNRVDTDGSGTIDPIELKSLLQSTYPDFEDDAIDSYRDIIMHDLDKNQDGHISLKEYLGSDWSKLLYDAGVLSDAAQRNHLANAFKEIDSDNSGAIDDFELLHVLRQVFPDVREDVRQMYYKQIVLDCDKDYDGRIDMEEFLNCSFTRVLSVREREQRVGSGTPTNSTNNATSSSACNGRSSSASVGPRESRCSLSSPKLLSAPMMPKAPRMFAFENQVLDIDGVQVQDCTAQELLSKGEEVLLDGRISFQWSEAREWFTAAAKQFEKETNWDQAGYSWVRSSDCRVRLKDELSAASDLVAASKCYKVVSPEDAMECLSQAITIEVKHRHIGSAAGHEKEIGDINAQEGNLDMALPHYQLASRYYEQAGNLISQDSIIHAIAEVFVRLEQHQKAIPYFVQLATHAHSTVFQSTTLLFNAWLCAFFKHPQDGVQYIDMIEMAQKTLEEYGIESEGIRYGSTSPEAEATQNISAAMRQKDTAALQEAITAYKERKQRLLMPIAQITLVLCAQLVIALKSYVEKLDEVLDRQLASITARINATRAVERRQSLAAAVAEY
eukprot:TRINITY_DN4011_c0_g1_i1.p2 TRINITY_DN4011_c0_g1~~TRINITY_DN4011_c0_g1_i1.p2  ORF type:complete len:608 (+),score=58.80 TRINITY_DN4011_c0_g1_i1:38-1861(+)